MAYKLHLWRMLRCASAATLLAVSACGGGGASDPVAAAVPTADTTAAAQAADAAAAEAQAIRQRDDRVRLGQQIFTDPDLSEPRGTACVA